MTTKQIIQLDCRESQNQKIIQKVLRQIKPLSKFSVDEEIPFSAIEKSVVVMSKKYNMRIRDFVPDIWSNSKGSIWRATIINDGTMATIEVVYGLSLYEVFAKCAIQMYAEVRRGISTRKQ